MFRFLRTGALSLEILEKHGGNLGRAEWFGADRMQCSWLGMVASSAAEESGGRGSADGLSPFPRSSAWCDRLSGGGISPPAQEVISCLEGDFQVAPQPCLEVNFFPSEAPSPLAPK